VATSSGRTGAILLTCLAWIPLSPVAATGMTTPMEITPGSIAESAAPRSELLQDAVASVVVVALTEQFDGRVIEVSIDDYDVQILGAREREVTGRGKVAVGDDPEDTVRFRYRTLYDVVTTHAAYPAITVDGAGNGGERGVPNDATLVGELDTRVASELSRELGGKPVWLQFDAIESYESAQRYVRIDAAGIADFGVEGRTQVRVEAVYDRRQDTWVRVHYRLGDVPRGFAHIAPTVR